MKVSSIKNDECSARVDPALVEARVVMTKAKIYIHGGKWSPRLMRTPLNKITYMKSKEATFYKKKRRKRSKQLIDEFREKEGSGALFLSPQKI